MARDEKRIPKVLEEIEVIWKKFPDLRLGQLINNAITEPYLYYIEDNKFIEELKRFYCQDQEEAKEKTE